MSSVCISKCMNDARDPRVPVRATYVNLYKWPESDAEFVRSISCSNKSGSTIRYGHPRVVDSISCRQMYLRSYKFSTHQHNHHHHRDRVSSRNSNSTSSFGRVVSSTHEQEKKEKRCLFLGKVKQVSRKAFFGVFRRCLSCTATVDVVDL